MNDNDTLNVWYEKSLVGVLWQDLTNRIGFRYEKNWLDTGFPISQQLSLNENPFLPETDIAHQYFANLLPEANARLHIVRDLKISNSDFALLKAIGAECAGALSILPTDEKPSDLNAYNKLNDNDLKRILLRKGRLSSFVEEGPPPRLLLAGAQDKCPIYVNNGDYFLPQGGSASTHILKFEVSDYRNIPLYEYFLTQLATEIDLPVIDIALKKIDKHYFLLIKRYDRTVNKHQFVQRLHQEDFCQALGISHEKKYQQEGGPSFQACYNLIRQISTHPIEDMQNLLKWQIFNVLAGNSDGHAKNLSLLYDKGEETRLAPFYDLVCTRAIENIDPNIALAVANEFNPHKITLNHWMQLADQCDIRQQYLLKVLNETAQTLLEKVDKVRETFENSFGSYPALQRVRQVVLKQCKKY